MHFSSSAVVPSDIHVVTLHSGVRLDLLDGDPFARVLFEEALYEALELVAGRAVGGVDLPELCDAVAAVGADE